MSDITITDKLVDKLTEAINKSVKKTDVFEKIEIIAVGFGLYMSFIGVITMYNFYSINNIKQIIDNNKEKSVLQDKYIDVKELAESIFKFF